MGTGRCAARRFFRWPAPKAVGSPTLATSPSLSTSRQTGSSTLITVQHFCEAMAAFQGYSCHSVQCRVQGTAHKDSTSELYPMGTYTDRSLLYFESWWVVCTSLIGVHRQITPVFWELVGCLHISDRGTQTDHSCILRAGLHIIDGGTQTDPFNPFPSQALYVIWEEWFPDLFTLKYR